VYAVNARRDHNEAEQSIKARWQAQIRVMEQDEHQDESLPQDERTRRNAQRDDLNHAEWNRQKKLPGMEAQRGRRIEIEVGVMSGVKPPKQRDPMIEPVPVP